MSSTEDQVHELMQKHRSTANRAAVGATGRSAPPSCCGVARSAFYGFGGFGGAFMKLKTPSLGVVRLGHGGEPSFREGPE
jgi:hypothetical protein